MIKPTVGRVVWLRRTDAIVKDQPESAQIVMVREDNIVNVAFYDHNGTPGARTSVFLRQPEAKVPDWAKHCYVEWMPYQQGQAAKTEQAEAQARGNLDEVRRMASAGAPLIDADKKA